MSLSLASPVRRAASTATAGTAEPCASVSVCLAFLCLLHRLAAVVTTVDAGSLLEPSGAWLPAVAGVVVLVGDVEPVVGVVEPDPGAGVVVVGEGLELLDGGGST